MFSILAVTTLGVAFIFLTGAAGAVRITSSNRQSLHSNTSSAQFDPKSVSFISTTKGWVLGSSGCSGGQVCLALRSTSNGGQSWSALSLPQFLLRAADRTVGGYPAAFYNGLSLQVHFADKSDGWIWGSLAVPTTLGGGPYVYLVPRLWSTHDAGTSWKEVPLPWSTSQGEILDLEAGSGTVYVMTTNKIGGVSIANSPVGYDNWRLSNERKLMTPAGGGQLQGAIILRGSSGWFVEGNDRGVTASGRLASQDRWVPWTAPCMVVGNGFTIPAASTTQDLVAECVMGGYASPLSPSAPKGATLLSTWLYFSADSGRTFRAGPELRPILNYYDAVTTPTPNHIFLLRSLPSSGKVLASFDRGRHWAVVYKRNVTSLTFMSATRGVGIAQSSSGANVMIMTSDGGRTWTPETL